MQEQDKTVDNNSLITILRNEIKYVNANRYMTKQEREAKVRQHEEHIRLIREGK